MWDYKSYQMRAANAKTLAEKAVINQELKDLYASLSDEDKKKFDEGLDVFLKTEAQRLREHYHAIRPQLDEPDLPLN
jgi:hypothetical protein